MGTFFRLCFESPPNLLFHPLKRYLNDLSAYVLCSPTFFHLFRLFHPLILSLCVCVWLPNLPSFPSSKSPSHWAPWPPSFSWPVVEEGSGSTQRLEPHLSLAPLSSIASYSFHIRPSRPFSFPSTHLFFPILRHVPPSASTRFGYSLTFPRTGVFFPVCPKLTFSYFFLLPSFLSLCNLHHCAIILKLQKNRQWSHANLDLYMKEIEGCGCIFGWPNFITAHVRSSACLLACLLECVDAVIMGLISNCDAWMDEWVRENERMNHPIYIAQMVYARHSSLWSLIERRRERERESEEECMHSKKETTNTIVTKGAPKSNTAPNTHSLFDSKHTPCSSTHITYHTINGLEHISA